MVPDSFWYKYFRQISCLLLVIAQGYAAVTTISANVGCEPPDLDEGAMIDTKPRLHYLPMSPVNVSCKAGYYSTSGHAFETMRCKLSPNDGNYQWVYDQNALICEEGCYAGNPSDYLREDFSEASPLLHIFEFMRIECGGIIKGWSYYNLLQGRAGSPVFVVVLDRVGLNSFRLANYTVIVTTQQQGWNTYTIPQKFRFRVYPGQVVALAYENWKLPASHLIIPYRYEDASNYPTYIGFLGIVNLDGKSEIKIGRDVYSQSKGRHPALFSLIEPEVSDHTTTTQTSTTTRTTTKTTVSTSTSPRPSTTATTTNSTKTTKVIPSAIARVSTKVQTVRISPMMLVSMVTQGHVPTEFLFTKGVQHMLAAEVTTSTTSVPTTSLYRGCGPALLVANAFIRSKTFVDNSRFNDKVLYECIDGYELSSRESQTATVAIAHCSYDQSWADLPQCIQVKSNGCGDIPIISGAALVHKSFEGARSMQTGDAVYFGCIDRSNHAPFPPGSELVYCKSDGSWTSPPMCLPNKQSAKQEISGPICDLIPVIRHGQEISRKFVHGSYSNVAHKGDTIRFACNGGYKIRDGIDTTNCTSSGQWQPLPKCDKRIERCDTTHLIVTVALPVPLSPTHLFYLRQYLKALPRAWTYLTATPSTEVVMTLIGMDASGAISSYTHSTPHDPLIRFDEWVDLNVRNWPETWANDVLQQMKQPTTNKPTGSYRRRSVDSNTSKWSQTVCGLLGPFCDHVGRTIESSNEDKDRPVRLLYITTSPVPLRNQVAGVVSVSNAEPLLGVTIEDLREVLDFESWVYLLSPETYADAEVANFHPGELLSLASMQPFYEQMSTSVELHWELIYPGNAFKHFLCSMTTPNITSSTTTTTNSKTQHIMARSMNGAHTANNDQLASNETSEETNNDDYDKV